MVRVKFEVKDDIDIWDYEIAEEMRKRNDKKLVASEKGKWQNRLHLIFTTSDGENHSVLKKVENRSRRLLVHGIRPRQTKLGT